MADEQKDQSGPATDVVTDPDPGVRDEQREPDDVGTSGPTVAIAPPRIRGTGLRSAAESRAGSAASAFARVRTVLATVVFTVALLAALALALGAILTALGANEDNAVVSGLLGLAGRLDGPFADVFTFDSAVKQVLVNWGIAAGVYLVAGRAVERLLRP